MIVEGPVPTALDRNISKLNGQMARTLNADVILVASQQGHTDEQLNSLWPRHCCFWRPQRNRQTLRDN
ncbi:MAG: BioD-like phosphotransacetylase family protein [Lentisphaeria bacterium]|jgi:BioD-like phosphotransacetylase family protein